MSIGAIAFGILSLAGAAYGQTPTMHFEPQTLATDLAGGYQVVACDVNHDGKTDLIALASNMTDLFWFENPGFENHRWERHVLASNVPHPINLAAWDIDGDGIPEIAVAYGFSMNAAQSPGNVAILHHRGDPRRPWDLKEIDRLPASHRLRWADIDGSGRKVLINAPLTAADAKAPEYRGHVPLVYYRPRDWKRQTIGDAEEGVVHGIFVTDWDSSGRDSLLIGSFLGIHLYSFGNNGTWTRTEITKGDPAPWPKSGTSDIAVGKLEGKRFLAAIEPWHGNQVVVYKKTAEGWAREVIDSNLLDGHTIAAVDLDGDGSDEIIAGFRGKPFGVYIYKLEKGSWVKHVLETGGMSAASCAVADLNGDGRPDVACIGSATHNLKVYWNRR